MTSDWQMCHLQWTECSLDSFQHQYIKLNYKHITGKTTANLTSINTEMELNSRVTLK